MIESHRHASPGQPSVRHPGDGPDERVLVSGRLVRSRRGTVSVEVGEWTCTVDARDVLTNEPAASVPADASPSDRFVSLSVSPHATVTLERRVLARELGPAGARPFVLARPSEAASFAIPASQAQRREAARFAALQLPGRDAPDGPVTASHSSTHHSTSYQSPTGTSMPTGRPGGGMQTDHSTDYVTDWRGDWTSDFNPEF